MPGLRPASPRIVAISSNDAVLYPDDTPDGLRRGRANSASDSLTATTRPRRSPKAYQAACTPDFYLFDAGQHLVYRGQFDEAARQHVPVTGKDLRAAIDAVLAGARRRRTAAQHRLQHQVEVIAPRPLDTRNKRRKIRAGWVCLIGKGCNVMRLLDRNATDKEDVRHMTRSELDSLGITILDKRNLVPPVHVLRTNLDARARRQRQAAVRLLALSPEPAIIEPAADPAVAWHNETGGLTVAT